MESFYDIALFLHIVCGAIFAMTLIIMQVVVGPALAKLPPGEGKQAAQLVVQTRWHPLVDVVIITLTITALFLAFSRWEMIAAEHYFHLKVATGVTALTLANLLHFYFRGKKRKLKADGETEKFDKMSRLTTMMERVALVTGPFAFLMGILWNHSPF